MRTQKLLCSGFRETVTKMINDNKKKEKEWKEEEGGGKEEEGKGKEETNVNTA